MNLTEEVNAIRKEVTQLDAFLEAAADPASNPVASVASVRAAKTVAGQVNRRLRSVEREAAVPAGGGKK